MKKIVVAFSGGLDTSYCAIHLAKDLGYEVHTLTVNTGGFDQAEVKAIESRAHQLGVTSHKTIDETKTYYDTVIRFLVYGNVLKNATYPLSVSAERMSQALAIVGADFAPAMWLGLLCFAALCAFFYKRVLSR